MAENSKIEWTDATWNVLRGCTRVSEGCRNCYAEGIAARFSDPGAPFEGIAKRTSGGPRWTGKVSFAEHLLDQPRRWKRPRRIFVNSMSDLFHEAVPDGWIMRMLYVMALCPQHKFQILTKRPERMRDFFTRWHSLDGEDFAGFKGVRGPDETRKAHPSGRGQLFASMLDSMGDPPPGAAYPTFDWQGGMMWWPSHVLDHIWLGTSVEDQTTADERTPHLLATPAAVRFLSCEPLLGPVDLRRWLDPTGIRCLDMCPDTRYLLPEEIDYLQPDGQNEVIPLCPSCGQTASATGYDPGLDWIITGGESGPGARPMHPDWARSLRDQCAAAGVPFLFKQWGEWMPVWDMPSETQESEEIAGRWDGTSHRVGKSRAGRLLDGVEHSGFPDA